MGQEIFYCHVCQTMLRSADFEKNKAVRIDGVAYCTPCAPARKKEAPAQVSERSIPAARPPAAARPEKSNVALFVAVGVAAVAILALVVSSASGSRPVVREEKAPTPPLIVDIPRPDPPKPPPAPEPPKPEPPKPEPPRPEPPKPVPAKPPEPPAPEPPKPEPPKPPESDAIWRSAMRIAAGRDYAAAIRELEKSKDLKADADELRALSAAFDDVQKAIAKLPKGQKLSLSHFADAGPQRVEGTLVRVEPFRLVLDTATVAIAELTAGSLAELLKGKPAALICAIEGDPKIPAEGKYATLDHGADPRDPEARKLFAAAEAEAGVPATAVDAVEKFAALLKSHGDTAFVRRNLPQIRTRLEGGKDYVFFADMVQIGGTFKPARSTKTGACVTSDADSPAANRKDNFIDFEFGALAADYRCWVYVGACCAEVAEFYVQAPEAAEPALAKHTLSFSSRKHTGHNGPKNPARWGWVSIPLGKFAQPGRKKLRLTSDQQGFSVAYGVISATRTAAPLEAEMRDWVRVVEPKFPSDPTLVAWWTCDAGSGLKLEDQTRNGNHGVLKAGAGWAAGKIGKALELDGAGGHVRVPTSPSFDTITKQVTLAAWVYRKGAPSDVKVILGREQGGGSEDQWMLGFLNNGVIFTIGPNKRVDTIGLPMEQWTHVAATFNGTAMLVYVNGAEISGTTLPPTDLAVESKPVTIGGSINGGDTVNEFFQGLIDDVRVYNRALPAAEIAALAKAKP